MSGWRRAWRALRARLARPGMAEALIVILALAARLPGLGGRPLWYDEAFAALFSRAGPAAMLRGTLETEAGVAADIHPLLYYTLLWLWQGLLGAAPATLRGLSVLFSLGAVGAGMALARRLFGPATARLAGLMLGLSPFLVHYGQEARMYSLLAVLLVCAAWAYQRGLEGGGALAWAAFAVLAAAAQYTHNLAFAFLVPLSLTAIMARRWRVLIATAAAGAGALLLYLPWLISLPSQLARVHSAYWIRPPGPESIVRTLLVYVSGLPLPDWALAPALAAALLVGVAAGWAVVAGLRERTPGARAAAWCLYLAAAPPALLLLVSLWRPVYLERALLPAAALFLIGLAWALNAGPLSRPLRLTAWIALGLAFALGLHGFYTYRGFPYAPFRELNAQLRAEAAPGEIILHSNKITALPSVYAGPDLEHRYLPDPPGSGSDTLAPATQRALGLLAERDAESAAAGVSGVWFVLFTREVDDYLALGQPGHPALTWLEANLRLVERRAFGDLTVYHFSR